MTFTDQLKVPRTLHPVAWWLWAGLVAATCSHVTQLLALVGICAIATAIAHQRRFSNTHWRTFLTLTAFACGIVIVRLMLQILFGAPVGNQVLFRLPIVHLPSWLSGLRLGGPVTSQSLLTALAEALRIVSTIMVLAAAACVTSATRLLRSLPASFHSFGMLVIIAVTFIPNIFRDVTRIQSAHRWRGSQRGKFSTLASNIVTVCAAALDRSVVLAGSMTTRGYGPTTSRNSSLSFGLLSLACGFGLWLAAPRFAPFAIAVIAFGAILISLHIVRTERESIRTRYRVDAWQLPETAVVISGVALAIVWTISPLAALFAGLLPLVLTPALPLAREVDA